MYQKIIAVANQKGGVGKSTIAMQLAGALALYGLKVLVVNADRQGTALKWSSHAPEGSPFPAACVNMFQSGDKLHREVQKLYQSYDVTIIDCPPNMESVIPASAVTIADLVLMPMKPTTTDLDSLTDFLPLVQRAQAVRDTLIARVLINQYKKSAMSQLTLAYLEKQGIQRLQTVIGDRTAYAEGDPLGSHVLAMKGIPAAVKYEIKQLRTEVLDLLGVDDE